MPTRVTLMTELSQKSFYDTKLLTHAMQMSYGSGEPDGMAQVQKHLIQECISALAGRALDAFLLFLCIRTLKALCPQVRERHEDLLEDGVADQ